MKYFSIALLFILLLDNNCSIAKEVIVAAERTEKYLPLLHNKKVGLIVNQTSVIKQTHLLDTLISLKINVVKVFAPEHGFRGTADAGENVKNGIDIKTKTPIISLYGNNKKPKAEQLTDLDIILFDIQDVGVRFYTYISTLEYVMEACAENNKELIVLDRPNPNGHYVNGPVLDTPYKSFVGMQQIPIVYGMTMGEYAQMLNGEKLLKNKVQCHLEVIKCLNYDHLTFYTLPIKPSPNLPNIQSIYLYPSLCFFEGTSNISLGRGTDLPFQIYGSPEFSKSLYSFTPISKPGATNPPLLNQKCYGYNLSEINIDTLRQQKFTLKYLINAYKNSISKANFFTSFFEQLVGTSSLRIQIEQGISEETIQKSWTKELNTFKEIRKKYLLYQDFE